MPSSRTPDPVNCPRCVETVLAPVQSRTGTYQAEACPRCRGLWIDASALSRALETSPDVATVPSHAFKSLESRCPRCKVGLFEYCFPGTSVLIDGCRQCFGVWLDRDEWSQIRASLRAIAPATTCPKCGTPQPSATACVNCGVVFEKFRQVQQDAARAEEARSREAQAREERFGRAPDPMVVRAGQHLQTIEQIFGGASSFRIVQRKEWLEILSPFELRNRYDVSLTGSTHMTGIVEEQSSSWFNVLGRQLLGAWRPATLLFLDDRQNPVFRMYKHLRLYFHELDVVDPGGRQVGSIRRRFHLWHANYDIFDAAGTRVMDIQGPAFVASLLPFLDRVFLFRKQGHEVGSLRKRWRGVLGETFTDADTFDATIDSSLPAQDKTLLFGAAFLIDFGNFESNESSAPPLRNILD